MTNSTLPIPRKEIHANMAILRELFRAAKESQKDYVEATVKFARHYLMLHRLFKGFIEQQNGLRVACKLSEEQVHRILSIGEYAEDLLKIQHALPPAQESLYEASRALKQHAPTVINAVKDGLISPKSTMREIREVRQMASAKVGSPTTAKSRRSFGGHRSGSLASYTPQKLAAFLQSHKLSFVRIVGDADIDAQPWGTVCRLEILATNVQRLKDGSIPKDVPARYQTLLERQLPKR